MVFPFSIWWQLFIRKQIVCSVIQCNMEAAKVRKPNWTEKECLLLVEAVRNREDRLFGKMKGPGCTKHSKVKEIAWEEVAQSVNSYLYIQHAFRWL